MMMHHLAGPFVGNVLVIAFASLVTVGCFVAAIMMLLRPGEKDAHHPKYRVLHDDR